MTSDDPAPPRDLTLTFLRHPFLSSLGSAGILFGVFLGMFHSGLAMSVGGAVFIFCFQWIAWRHGGWARRREERIHGAERLRDF